jgi:hypothetical protein
MLGYGCSDYAISTIVSVADQVNFGALLRSRFASFRALRRRHAKRCHRAFDERKITAVEKASRDLPFHKLPSAFRPAQRHEQRVKESVDTIVNAHQSASRGESRTSPV